MTSQEWRQFIWGCYGIFCLILLGILLPIIPSFINLLKRKRKRKNL